ncbi:MAG: DNA-directed RNA polymerase subunit omega [Fimbriimonadaceae bacterium]|nr:DNA-directed RNA polymerase subunit omega [Fimbriimonadaceae bacterium]QYK55451.1 MAG: DNA-directed RNA polymerase subunit omega [Fimbriimonadaceae bacterium]
MVQGEKILPHPDILNEVEYGRFVLTNLAAKRARQIKDGAPPLVRIDSGHPLSIALAEIAAGKIKPAMAADGEVIEGVDYASLESLEIADIGLVLSDEEGEEDELTRLTKSIGIGDLGIEDDELLHEDDEEELEGEAVEVAAEEEEDVLDELLDDEPAAADDDSEISLEDLAEQEEESEEEPD